MTAETGQHSALAASFSLMRSLDRECKAQLPACSCERMEQVRAEIDRIDRLLVEVLCWRTAYIEAAARIKKHQSEVRLRWRIEDVLEKVARRAQGCGLPESLSLPVWRVIVENSIRHEEESWIKQRDSSVEREQ